MDVSLYLHDLVHKKQNPDGQRYLSDRVSACFTQDSDSSWLDIRFVPDHGSPVITGKAEVDVDSIEEKTRVALRGPDGRTLTLPSRDIGELTHVLENGTQSRMIFVRQRNSASRLNISWHLFDAMCQACNCFEKIRDYVICFGTRNGEHDVNPPALHFSIRPQAESDVGVNSNSEFECAYVLRFVEPNHRQSGNPWSVRQTGVYHSYIESSQRSTWIFIAISSQAEAQLRAYEVSLANEGISNPFEIHIILFNASVGEWRRYVVHLANEIRKQADRAVLVDLEEEELVATRLEELQYLKQIEDNVVDLETALSFTNDNITALIELYQSFLTRLRFKQEPRETAHFVSDDDILIGLKTLQRDLVLLNAQTRSLFRKVKSASQLVSNILNLDNGNALKILALQSHTENATMALLTKKSVEDAAAVKVLTIITLIYLPVTVITNFFSTQFVNSYSDQNHLSVTSDVWILFAISVPLTIITIYVWWIFARREVDGNYPHWWGAIPRFARTVLPAFSSSGRHRRSLATPRE